MDKLTTGQPKITGYRNLTQVEIDLMNRIKAHGEETRRLINDINTHLGGQEHDADSPEPSTITNPYRWLAIGTTDLQQGLMAITRAVAQPTTF